MMRACFSRAACARVAGRHQPDDSQHGRAHQYRDRDHIDARDTAAGFFRTAAEGSGNHSCSSLSICVERSDHTADGETRRVGVGEYARDEGAQPPLVFARGGEPSQASR
jgi:hypothetical protein